MGDYASSVPVRTENHGDVVMRMIDETNTYFWDIDSAGAGLIRATDLDIRDLTSASDSIEVLQSTAANLNATVVATDFDIRDLDYSSDSVEVRQATAANLNATVVATDFDIRDLDSSQDSVMAKQEAGDVYEVHINESGSGDEIHDYQSDTIGASSSANHIYTVTAGKTLYLRQIGASGSGKVKVEIQVGPSGSEVTKFVLRCPPPFDTRYWDLPVPLVVAATNNVKLIKHNIDKGSQDVDTVIVGLEK